MTSNDCGCVCVCVRTKYKEWVLWQQVMVLTLNVCILENRTAMIKEKPQTQTLRVNSP